MLVWSIAYDPILDTTERATGAECPTFVNDLAALTNGPSQTTRTQLFLMVASHAAGLEVGAHECHCLVIHHPDDRVQAILARYPLRTKDRGQGTLEVGGLPPQLVADTLTAALGDHWALSVDMRRSGCHCRFKTAVIPSTRLDRWADAIGVSPIGRRP